MISVRVPRINSATNQHPCKKKMGAGEKSADNWGLDGQHLTVKLISQQINTLIDFTSHAKLLY